MSSKVEDRGSIGQTVKKSQDEMDAKKAMLILICIFFVCGSALVFAYLNSPHLNE